MKYILPFLMMISISQSIFAQDNIYLLYNQLPLTVNPALSGSGCSPRASVYYQQLSNDLFDFFNYYAKGINFDIPIVLKNNDKIGLGYKLMHDVAGETKYTNFCNYLSLAYHKSLSKNEKEFQYISLGIDAGVLNTSINGKLLRWPSQITSNGFNPSLPGEDIDLSVRYFDINLGIAWTGHISEKIKSTAGIAVNHFSKPNRSFFGDSNNFLDRRYVYHMTLDFAINDRWSIVPSGYFTQQYQYDYYICSANIGHQLTNTTKVQLGGGYAKNDQPFVNATLNYKMLNLGVAYGFENKAALDKFEIVLGYAFGDYSCSR
jgi:type IX secretion system PorP/SprF family membrane protein